MTANTRSAKPTPDVPRRAWSIDEWRAMYGLGRNSVYNLIASGDLLTVKIGRRRLVTEEGDELFRKTLHEASA